MTAELLEGTFTYTAGRSHYIFIQLQYSYDEIEIFVPKTATIPKGKLLSLAFDARTASRATIIMRCNAKSHTDFLGFMNGK